MHAVKILFRTSLLLLTFERSQKVSTKYNLLQGSFLTQIISQSSQI